MKNIKIEHLTLTTGNSVVRNSKSIKSHTIKELKHFQVGINQTRLLPFHPIEPTVNVAVFSMKEYAIFYMMNNNQPLIANICCFDKEYNEEAIEMVLKLESFFYGMNWPEIRMPITSNWIYSIIIPTENLISNEDKMMLFGEVELFIYYSLLLGRKHQCVKEK